MSLESGLQLKLFMPVTEDLNEYIELSLSCKLSTYAIISVIYGYTQQCTLILNMDFRNISYFKNCFIWQSTHQFESLNSCFPTFLWLLPSTYLYLNVCNTYQKRMVHLIDIRKQILYFDYKQNATNWTTSSDKGCQTPKPLTMYVWK